MAAELAFKDEAAAEYDRAFAHVTAYFMPFLLQAAHIAPGMHVLDIATGTGLSAEAALAAVGSSGHVMAADVSPLLLGLYWVVGGLGGLSGGEVALLEEVERAAVDVKASSRSVSGERS